MREVIGYINPEQDRRTFVFDLDDCELSPEEQGCGGVLLQSREKRIYPIAGEFLHAAKLSIHFGKLEACVMERTPIEFNSLAACTVKATLSSGSQKQLYVARLYELRRERLEEVLNNFERTLNSRFQPPNHDLVPYVPW